MAIGREKDGRRRQMNVFFFWSNYMLTAGGWRGNDFYSLSSSSSLVVVAVGVCTHTHKIRQKGEGERWSEHAQCSVIVLSLSLSLSPSSPPSITQSVQQQHGPLPPLLSAVLCCAASESESVAVLLSFRTDRFLSLSSLRRRRISSFLSSDCCVHRVQCSRLLSESVDIIYSN